MQLQYIGARYVPVWYHNSVDDTANWEINVEYEPLTFVTSQNNHLYLSKKTVPDNIGTPAENTEYWLDMGTFSGSYSELVEMIGDLDDLTTTNKDDLVSAINEIVTNIGTLTDLKTTDQNSIVGAINEVCDKLEKNLLVIGNSYVIRNVTTKLESHFDHSYRKAYGGSGFVARSNNITTFGVLLDQAIADTSIDLSSITDIIFVSAMGDSWGITEQGADTYKSSLDTALASLKLKIDTNFPNCKRMSVTLAESKNYAYFGDCRYDAMFYMHKFLKELCIKNNFDYIGWTGWNMLFSGAEYFENDHYHPSPLGAEYIGLDIVNAYFSHIEYITKSSSDNCNLMLTSSGTITVNVQMTPDLETICLRVGNITAGAQTITAGSNLIDLRYIKLRPLAPLDRADVYLQTDVTSFVGGVKLTTITCDLKNDTNGLGQFTFTNSDGNNIGSSQVFFKEWALLSFAI